MSPSPTTHTREFPQASAAAAMPALALYARLRAFRTLIKNEWRQLRPLRWAGYGLGILLPFLFIAGADAASRGWSPLVSIPEYSLRTILIEAVPLALALGLWPLTALLTTTQAFTGDRASGTEAFLLERPLPPSHVWLARLAAASGATLAVALASGFAWLLLVSITGLLPDEGILHALRTLLLLSPYTLAATASVPLAASFLEQPVSVLLLGLALAAAPLGAGSLLARTFHRLETGGMSVGSLIPWLLLPGYAAASYVALCRGEPSGRGRRARCGLAMGAALGVLFITFMLSAVALPRHRSWRAGKEDGGSLFPSPRGRSVLFRPSRQGNMDMGAWLIDAAAGRSLAFLEPPVYQAAWSPDGSTLAVAPSSGFLGTDAPPSILLLDENGRERSRIHLADDCRPIALYWTQDGIVFPVSRQAFGVDLFVVSPASGEKRVIHVQRDWGSWGIVGPTTEGRLYIAMTAEGVRQKWDERGSLRPTPYWLYALDTKAGSIGSRPIIEESEGEPWLASARLSPSGRYWVREPRGRFDQATVVRDLVTGAEVEMGRLHQLAWLDGERAFWTERMGGEARLVSAHPGETPQALRIWKEARIGIGLQPSPDRARLLVSVWRVHGQGSAGPGSPGRAGGSQAGVGGNEARICGPPDEETVFEPASGRWTELPAWKTSCPLPSTPVAPST